LIDIKKINLIGRFCKVVITAALEASSDNNPFKAQPHSLPSLFISLSSSGSVEIHHEINCSEDKLQSAD